MYKSLFVFVYDVEWGAVWQYKCYNKGLLVRWLQVWFCHLTTCTLSTSGSRLRWSILT